MRPRRRAPLALALICAAALLAGCGDDTQTASTGDGTTTSGVDATTTSEADVADDTDDTAPTDDGSPPTGVAQAAVDDLAERLGVAPDDITIVSSEAVTWSDLWRRLKAALGTRRPAIHVPFWLARGPATIFERIPPALVTRDQLRMLEGPDNVVTDGGASMRRLGLGDLVGLDEQLRRAAAAAGREMQRHG